MADSKESEEEPREGSGSSPPSSVSVNPDQTATPDINLQATEVQMHVPHLAGGVRRLHMHWTYVTVC